MGEDWKNANRVQRVGSWAYNGSNVRSAYRNHNSPHNRNDIGLRLALVQYRIGITVYDQIKPSLLRKQITRNCRVSEEVDASLNARRHSVSMVF